MTDFQGRTVAVYLARGSDPGSGDDFRRFVHSYQTCTSGLTHDLVVVFKGFPSVASLEEGRSAFAGLRFEEIHTDDLSFDIGAYAAAIPRIECDRICFLNTKSEPVGSDWLLKLALNLEQPGVGLVGATGSYEAGTIGVPFPNVHIRSNAFMMRAALARRILGGFKIASKLDAYLAEHGFNGITRQVFASGQIALVIGKNGRGYSPEWWSSSRTFRQGSQSNLMVRDGQTRTFESSTWNEKKRLYEATWGQKRTPGAPFGYAIA